MSLDITLTNVEPTKHFNRPTFNPITIKQEDGKYVEAYHRLFGKDTPAEVQEKTRKLEIDLIQLYNEGVDKDAKQWIDLFSHSKMKHFDDVVAPEGFEVRNSIRYLHRGWKADISVESNFKVYFIQESNFVNGRAERKYFSVGQMKVAICDILWLAAVGMHLRATWKDANTMPIWFSSNAIYKAVANLVYNHTKVFEYEEDTQKLLFSYIKEWVGNVWNGLTGTIRTNNVTRAWLEMVAQYLNKQVAAFDTYGNYKYHIYSAEDDWRGGCDVDMRNEYLKDVKDWLRGVGSMLDGNEQRKLIRVDLAQHPEFKPSMVNWVFNELKEPIEGGELLLHPFDYHKIEHKQKDFLAERIKVEGDKWYFPRKLSTNANFRRWVARKSLEVSFKLKFA